MCLSNRPEGPDEYRSGSCNVRTRGEGPPVLRTPHLLLDILPYPLHKPSGDPGTSPPPAASLEQHLCLPCWIFLRSRMQNCLLRCTHCLAVTPKTLSSLFILLLPPIHIFSSVPPFTLLPRTLTLCRLPCPALHYVPLSFHSGPHYTLKWFK